MINAEVLAFRSHDHDAGNKVIDETKTACFVAGALNFETESTSRLVCLEPVQTQRELRDHVLESHVRAIDVVWPKDQHTLKKLAAEVDRHHLTDQFACTVAIAWIMRVGHHKRGTFVGRNFRRRLIYFRAGRQDKGTNSAPAARVDYIDHSAHTNIEHEFREFVEKLRPVDESKVMYFVHPLRGAQHGVSVANIAINKFDFAGYFFESARIAA